MDNSVVVREERGSVSVISMCYRPYNLLGPVLVEGIATALKEAEKAGSRAVVLRSDLRHFCAGADLSMFTNRLESGSTQAAFNGLEFLELMETLPIPIIASVHGVCLGGGLELALASDYVVAAASAKLGSVERTLGLHPLLGAIQRQTQRIGALRAKEMSMLGRRYDAATLERWGLINLVVADDNLEKVTMAIAEEFANGPTVAHAATKLLVQVAVNHGVRVADEAMGEIQKPIWASEDLKAGLKSFAESGPGLAKFVGR